MDLLMRRTDRTAETNALASTKWTTSPAPNSHEHFGSTMKRDVNATAPAANETDPKTPMLGSAQ